MKSVLFFSGEYFSHIKPITPLLKTLRNSDFEVYILGNPRFKNLYSKNDCKFLPMPEDSNEKLDNNVNKIITKMSTCQNFDDYLFLNNEQSLLSMHNFSLKIFNAICNMVDKIKPDYIFKDAIDIYADMIGRKYQVPVIGYITNILYDRTFFERNPELLYSIFSRSLGYREYLKDPQFVDDYAEYINRVNDYVENKFHLYHKDVFQQFDPSETINIIFSSKYIQPKSSRNNLNIIWLPNNMTKKDLVTTDDDILKLYRDNKKIIYISNGSFINIGDVVFKKLLVFFENYDVDIVVNGGVNSNSLIRFVKEKKLHNQIIIKEFVPQKNILQHCSLFVTHGGFNSLIEGTIYKVPMLILPISPEQRLNGFLWDSKKIAVTDYKPNKKNTGEIIDNILNNKISLKYLDRYSTLIKSELSNEESMEDLIRKIGIVK